MKNKYSDIELIERFQRNELTEEEQRIFHQRLLEDETFTKSVQLHLNIAEEIDSFWTNKMMDKIGQWETIEQRKTTSSSTPAQVSETVLSLPKKAENPQKRIPKKVNNRKKKLSLFATLLLLVVVIWYFFKPVEPVDLYTQHFIPYEDVIENHNAEDSDLLTLAMSAYSAEDFSVARRLFLQFQSEVDSISTQNQTASEFYLAISNMKVGNINTAQQQLLVIASNNKNPFQQQAEWYLALATIKNNDIEKAKNYLKTITNNTKHTYLKNAKKLLKALPS